ncbi:DUF6489 family protein [Pistricoccus aurantiacus]|uniref:Uncharacterized protein n=1 Tax=Pistricoccus aurantiacus TaxID=1883414 RepID=A0A5B8SUK5_9GAMM|nr:DUF6489 family protein [Pistricoccus aurantiacus]QEA40426.1 hypothetical protein FGL86_15995 [Pistricoccus aurantiacus]
MKINVEFDLTPNEFRQAMGLPDVEAFQRDLMNRIQKQMEAGVEGYDPMSLMQPFLQLPFMQQPSFLKGGLQESFNDSMSQGLANLSNYQQMMLDMMRQAQTTSSADEGSQGQEESASKPTGTRKKTPASATSRSKRQVK